MAKGIGEQPSRSPANVLHAVEFPASRDEIVRTAEDEEAPAEVINFLKCLPEEQYRSLEAALRDLAEAARRFGVGGQGEGPDRRNIGRAAGEDSSGGVRHP
jgi:hypothetical protein